MLPAFPPKKLFSLTPAEVEQRREQLEKYMQAGEWSEKRTLGSHHGGLWGKGANVILVQGWSSGATSFVTCSQRALAKGV